MLQSIGTRFLALGVGMAGIMAYGAWDRTSNYYSVEAKVMKVETLCYLKRTDRDGLEESTWTTEEGSCDVARTLAEGHPDYKGATVHENNYVEVSYRAEGEGRGRRGKMTINRNTPKRGEKVTILVHKDEPEKITR